MRILTIDLHDVRGPIEIVVAGNAFEEERLQNFIRQAESDARMIGEMQAIINDLRYRLGVRES